MSKLSKVVFSVKTPPYCALVVGYALVVSKHISPAIFAYGATDKDVELNGEIVGSHSVSRTLATLHPSSGLYGSSPAVASQIDYWVDLAQDSLKKSTDFHRLNATIELINSHLKLRSFLVGYSVSLADYAVWGALKANSVFNSQLKNGKTGSIEHLGRWFVYIASLPQVKQALEALDKAKKNTSNNKPQEGSLEINLPGAVKGKVVTRFPPEPSGYLHIGHAKAAMLNDYFARMYDGKLILRFDDTNPSKEKMEFESSIKEDLSLLGIHGDVVTHTSDYFDLLYDLAVKLISNGNAYVDETDLETMRAERFDGIESKFRNRSIQENLSRFQEMKNGSEIGLKSCLRAKIDMKDNNKAMRDPVIYRCNLTPHHFTGTKWKMYPTYDFACPIVDSHEGVTHALRTNEYRDRNPQYEWFLKTLELRWVHIWDFSRMSFIYTLLSKRKLTWFVEQKLVTGWDDPRFPTVRGIRRRGMTVEALRQYIVSQGASQRQMLLEWDKLWAFNKKVIDPVAPRHTAIAKLYAVTVTVVGETVALSTKQVPKHKKNPDAGLKTTVYSGEFLLEQADAKDLAVDEEVTLMDWGNAIVNNIEKDAAGNVKAVKVKLNLAGDFKKTKKKLTWLSSSPTTKEDEKLVNLTLLDYDYLITKKKIEEDDDINDFITKETEFKVEAFGDANLRLLKKNDIIQLERKGFHICDKSYDVAKPSEPIHLIFIPDGHAGSIASKSAGQDTAPPKQHKHPKAATTNNKPAVNDDGNMYVLDPIYGKQPKINPEAVTTMYKVDSVYGADEANEVIADTGKKPKEAKKAKPSVPKQEQEASIVSKLDIVVGKILDVKKHPDADSLYVEQIDVGEEAPREVVSGLVKFMTEDEIRGKTVLVLKNLKPVSMRGIKSFAMVLCASDASHEKVEFLIPPPNSVPGDRVFFAGHEGTPEGQLNPKKKVWETVQPDFATRDDLVAVWKDVPFQTAKGLVKTASIAKASIK